MRGLRMQRNTGRPEVDEGRRREDESGEEVAVEEADVSVNAISHGDLHHHHVAGCSQDRRYHSQER